ncbi:MAG: hypothetical protein PHP93_07035 [Kiritimatiellales bacterium]|nr:hypothetical protein [Kiritimatiellales bacterium]
MNEANTSLIQTGQEMLWTDEQVPRELRDIESKEGIYTGARLFLSKPDTYRCIYFMLGAVVPKYRIAKELSVHHKTVSAVEEREAGPIAQQKKRWAMIARQGASMAMESLLDDIAGDVKIPAKDKAIIVGILTDTADKLDRDSGFDGGTFEGSTPGHEAYDEFLSGLTDAERAALAKMGRAAEKAGAKERAANPAIEAEFSMRDEGISS